jgi:hypothetical protein
MGCAGNWTVRDATPKDSVMRSLKMSDESKQFIGAVGRYKELWASVLAQAITDIFIFHNKMTVVRADVVYAHRAWIWVHSQREENVYDCLSLCKLIGMSHDRVIRFVASMREELFWHLSNISAVQPYREKIRTRCGGTRQVRSTTGNFKCRKGTIRRRKDGGTILYHRQVAGVDASGILPGDLSPPILGGQEDKAGSKNDPISNPPAGAIGAGVVLDGGVYPSQGAREGGL